jgi:NAD+ kinase
MNVIGLQVAADRPKAVEWAHEIVRLATSFGIGVAVADEVRGLASTQNKHVSEAEMIVSIGGDGTLLRGVRLAVPLDVPILGVNTGRLGFLTEIETTTEGLERLARVLRGDFGVEERVALQVSVNHVGSHFALNDVVVRRGAQARMAPFGLSLDGEPIAHIPSDGVIVATPTGSTAYFLSAGGPIIAPTVEAFGIAALLPHTFFARPLIVPISSTIEITCDSEIVHANLETDGTFVSDLSSGDLVTIVRAPRPVKFARAGSTGSHAFFARLEEKLQWGVPIKHA